MVPETSEVDPPALPPTSGYWRLTWRWMSLKSPHYGTHETRSLNHRRALHPSIEAQRNLTKLKTLGQNSSGFTLICSTCSISAGQKNSTLATATWLLESLTSILCQESIQGIHKVRSWSLCPSHPKLRSSQDLLANSAIDSPHDDPSMASFSLQKHQCTRSIRRWVLY